MTTIVTVQELKNVVDLNEWLVLKAVLDLEDATLATAIMRLGHSPRAVSRILGHWLPDDDDRQALSMATEELCRDAQALGSEQIHETIRLIRMAVDAGPARSGTKMAEAKPASWALEQALGILAVDNLSASPSMRELLRRVDHGEMTSEQAREAILQRARSYANDSEKN
jgi:hypothetical protein